MKFRVHSTSLYTYMVKVLAIAVCDRTMQHCSWLYFNKRVWCVGVASCCVGVVSRCGLLSLK